MLISLSGVYFKGIERGKKYLIAEIFDGVIFLQFQYFVANWKCRFFCVAVLSLNVCTAWHVPGGHGSVASVLPAMIVRPGRLLLW